jgi:hypothetical protein
MPYITHFIPHVSEYFNGLFVFRHSHFLPWKQGTMFTTTERMYIKLFLFLYTIHERKTKNIVLIFSKAHILRC